MSALTQIVEEMATAIRDIFDGYDYGIQVEPRRVLNPTPPTIDIYPADPYWSLDEAGLGELSGGLLFNVRARVPTADSESWQDLLLALMDDEDDLCVAAALFDEQTLNGTASSVEIESLSGYRVFEDLPGTGAYLGVVWGVKVIPARS